jgi:predicted nucleotidyltransferase
LKAVFSFLQSTIGLVPTFKLALEDIGIERAYLFGSYAKQEADSESDIDLLIVGEPSGANLAAAVAGLEEWLNREVSYTVLHPEESGPETGGQQVASLRVRAYTWSRGARSSCHGC